MEKLSVYVDEQVLRSKAGVKKVSLSLGLAVLLAAVTLVAVNAKGSPARALSAQAADKTGNVVPQATGCTVTFTNPGPAALTVCVSGHGNVNNITYSAYPGLGPAVNHVSTGEGYCLRNLDSGTAYYDSSTAEAGWGVATQSSTATTTTVTRTTTDGVFTLTQNIFFKYGSRMVLVGNLLKNNDAASHNVRLSRYADFDVDQVATNDFDIAGSSVVAQRAGGNGVALTGLANPSQYNFIGSEAYGDWITNRSTCNHVLVFGPATGDRVSVLQQGASIAPGATVNFRVGYRLL